MKTTVAGVQMDIELAQPQRNVERMIERLREASGAGARIAVFPECAVTGYCFDSSGAVLVAGQGHRETYALRDLTHCRTKYAGFLDTLVVFHGLTFNIFRD